MNLYVITQGSKIGLKDGESYIKTSEDEILNTYVDVITTS